MTLTQINKAYDLLFKAMEPKKTMNFPEPQDQTSKEAEEEHTERVMHDLVNMTPENFAIVVAEAAIERVRRTEH